MTTIRYTLLSDGSSDRMLLPILDWLLHQHCPEHAVQSEWADLGRLPQPPKVLPERIKKALELCSSCDLLFIHRDAEKEYYETRHAQIINALDGLETPPAICVIPVRMLEAWLLFDELAIRKAAGKPNGRISLDIPSLDSVERLLNPKQVLFDLIGKSSESTGTRLKKLKTKMHRVAHLVSQKIEDFSPLRNIQAFKNLESELLTVIQQQGWNL
jgi:hypothetical protein